MSTALFKRKCRQKYKRGNETKEGGNRKRGKTQDLLFLSSEAPPGKRSRGRRDPPHPPAPLAAVVVIPSRDVVVAAERGQQGRRGGRPQRRGPHGPGLRRRRRPPRRPGRRRGREDHQRAHGERLSPRPPPHLSETFPIGLKRSSFWR